jgi:hypothetical protein
MGRVTRGIRLELRLAARAAEQDVAAFVKRAVRRVGLHRHAADGILRGGRGKGVVMLVVMIMRVGHCDGLLPIPCIYRMGV